MAIVGFPAWASWACYESVCSILRSVGPVIAAIPQYLYNLQRLLPHLLAEVHTMKYIIPGDFKCQKCTLQWYYATANSCLPDNSYRML